MSSAQERGVFEALQPKELWLRIYFSDARNSYDIMGSRFRNDLFTINAVNKLNFGWEMWQKAKAHQWTSIEDESQLPKEGERVIVYGDYGCGESSMIEQFNHYLYKRQGITHWMPLPGKPEQKSLD